MVAEYVGGEYMYKPLLDGDGNAVVRNVTAEDIDALGEACVHTLFAD